MQNQIFESISCKQVMNTIIKLEDIEAEVVRKNIRNIHLRVLPPDGKVRISAPFRTKNESIYKLNLFTVSDPNRSLTFFSPSAWKYNC